MIGLVDLEMLGEVFDLLGQEGDLDFRRTGVLVVQRYWVMTSCFLSLANGISKPPHHEEVTHRPGSGVQRRVHERDLAVPAGNACKLLGGGTYNPYLKKPVEIIAWSGFVEKYYLQSGVGLTRPPHLSPRRIRAISMSARICATRAAPLPRIGAHPGSSCSAPIRSRRPTRSPVKSSR